MNISGPSLAPGDTALPIAAPTPGVAATSSAPAATSQSADLALVIENDKAAGELVYKTVDRATGALVSQYPNEKLVRMREASNYAPGELIRQSV